MVNKLVDVVIRYPAVSINALGVLFEPVIDRAACNVTFGELAYVLLISNVIGPLLAGNSSPVVWADVEEL